MAFDIYEWSMRAYLMLKTRRRGKHVGTDPTGNRYYVDKRSAGTRRERRWVVFDGGESEASRVPPEWHGWLHHQVKEPPGEQSPYRQQWQKEHVPNLTGTLGAYRPPGHTLEGGKRAAATGDYEPWVPD
ncbi:MAG: NADH:ubiquinone oxidoreductase subunit NDUFA12 [Azospirillaceae bacterium]